MPALKTVAVAQIDLCVHLLGVVGDAALCGAEVPEAAAIDSDGRPELVTCDACRALMWADFRYRRHFRRTGEAAALWNRPRAGGDVLTPRLEKLLQRMTDAGEASVARLGDVCEWSCSSVRSALCELRRRGLAEHVSVQLYRLTPAGQARAGEVLAQQ